MVSVGSNFCVDVHVALIPSPVCRRPPKPGPVSIHMDVINGC